jgi:peptide-methionine (S)-S-oxide reductase
MNVRAALTAFALLSLLGASYGSAQTASPTPAAVPPPSERGPVLVDGRTWTTIDFAAGNTVSVTASQANVPRGTLFIANPGVLCNGAVTVAGTKSLTPTATITSTGPFSITRKGVTTGCQIAITSSAGGVIETAVGYAGGTLENPSYEQVCSDATGHAEVVQVRFDPSLVSYEQFVGLFFQLHDPTQRNRQGPDVGSQYRSVIFTHSEDQDRTAKATIERLQAEKVFRRDIVTAVEPAGTFWRAEDYHQRYLARRGRSHSRV